MFAGISKKGLYKVLFFMGKLSEELFGTAIFSSGQQQKEKRVMLDTGVCKMFNPAYLKR